MKFLIDAQLPKSLADFLCDNDHESIHTFSLPEKNKTTDKAIIEFAFQGDYVVVTKDLDF